MAYEMVEKAATVGFRPDCWYTTPAIYIRKHCILFNQCLMETFGLTIGGSVCVFADYDNKKIGFKTPINDIEIQNSYALQDPKSKNKKDGAMVTCYRIITKFEDSIDKVYKAKMNPHQLVIEVDINEIMV